MTTIELPSGERALRRTPLYYAIRYALLFQKE